MELLWKFAHNGTEEEDAYPKASTEQKFLHKASGHRKEKIRRFFRRLTNVPKWYKEKFLKDFLNAIKRSKNV
jgi:hypothetical protein